MNRQTSGRAKALRLAAALLLLLVGCATTAHPSPSVCDAYAAEEPLAIPTTEITEADLIGFLEYGRTLAGSTLELLREDLERGGRYSDCIDTGNRCDLVGLLILTEKVGQALDRGSYMESMCLLTAQTAVLLLHDHLDLEMCSTRCRQRRRSPRWRSRSTCSISSTIWARSPGSPAPMSCR